MSSIRRWATATEKEQVTETILDAAEDIANGWYLDKSIDWPDFIDRLDGMELPDGTRLDLGNSFNTTAIRYIKNHINNYRKEH